MGCFFLCDGIRHLEVKDMVGDSLNCILAMGVAVKIKTPHVLHLEENSYIPLCTPPHSSKRHAQYIGKLYRKQIQPLQR